MKNYFDQILSRVEYAYENGTTPTPREFTPGEPVGVMSMLVKTGEDKIIGLRLDKFGPFLQSTPDDVLRTMKIFMGFGSINVVDNPDTDHCYGQAHYRPDLQAMADRGELPPNPPVFRLKKHREAVTFDYDQIQNFIWETTEDHPANPASHGDYTDCYLDVEYFLFTIVRKSQRLFDLGIRYFVQFLSVSTQDEEAWIATYHHRINALRQQHHRPAKKTLH